MASVWGKSGNLAVFLNWGGRGRDSGPGEGGSGTLPVLHLLGEDACVLFCFLIHSVSFQRPHL